MPRRVYIFLLKYTVPIFTPTIRKSVTITDMGNSPTSEDEQRNANGFRASLLYVIGELQRCSGSTDLAVFYRTVSAVPLRVLCDLATLWHCRCKDLAAFPTPDMAVAYMQKHADEVIFESGISLGLLYGLFAWCEPDDQRRIYTELQHSVGWAALLMACASPNGSTADEPGATVSSVDDPTISQPIAQPKTAVSSEPAASLEQDQTSAERDQTSAERAQTTARETFRPPDEQLD